MNTSNSKSDKTNNSHLGGLHMERNDNKELKDFLRSEYRVLPLFEKALAEDALTKHYSFNNNRILASKWMDFKNSVATRIRCPIDFPHIRDYHFYKYHNCYKPSESIKNRIDFRYGLVPGPGVDAYGEIPIPVDMSLR